MSSLVSLQLLLYAVLWLLCALGLKVARAPMLHWMGYALASAVSIALIAWRPDGPVWLTHSGASIAVLLSLVLAGRGVQLFMTMRPDDRQFAAIVLVAVLAFAWIGPDNTAARVGLNALLCVWVLLLVLVQVRKEFIAEFGMLTAVVAAMPAVALACMNTFFVVRSLRGGSLDIQGNGAIASGTWVVTLVAAAAFNYLFLFLVGFRLQEALRRQARQDALTGLANRRAMELRLQIEWARAVRYTKPFVVICVDVDHFKAVNDLHGHATGDLALVAVARALQTTVRDTDHVSRVGGEEFTVLMPEANAHTDGVALAERLRTAIAALELRSPDNTPIPLRASFGVAQWLVNDLDKEQTLRRADHALYAAKTAGRDRVVVHNTAPLEPSRVSDPTTP